LLAAFKKYKPDLVAHLAAQTTMVTSVENPREDFEINALGTFNVLEAMRKGSPKASLIYSSTNKVMGELNYLPVIKRKKRYTFKNIKGVSEKYPLDFHGPYGCSKGAGDQYTIDYARIYGLNTIVFRQSGIYGPHQFGIEEQGWLAWFTNAILFNKPVTIYGDGRQVRDVLYIDDLIKAFNLAFKNIKKTRGKAYTVGGGPKFSLSIWELFEILEKLSGKKFNYKFGPWRPGDQKIYISDLSSAKKDFKWSPKVSPQEGVRRLYNWISQNKNLIKKAGVFKG
jgi:CDP-paratose 2-epimerase